MDRNCTKYDIESTYKVGLVGEHRAYLMTFSDALDAAKYGIGESERGVRIAREGWNGKGMFVVYQKSYPEGICINKNTAEATGIPEGTVCKFRPYLMLKTANDEFVPWVASQSDILAEDWYMIMSDEELYEVD